MIVVVIAIAVGLAGCGSAKSSSSSAGVGAPPSSRTAEGSKGGEASIEEFGSEASGSEREAILSVFTGYMSAVADKDYVAACRDLSAAVQRALRGFAPGTSKRTDCAAILPALLAPSAAQVAREQANGKIARVRVAGDRAFVVFHAPGAKLYQLPMVEEGGEWKATTVAAAVLVPEL